MGINTYISYRQMYFNLVFATLPDPYGKVLWSNKYFRRPEGLSFPILRGQNRLR